MGFEGATLCHSGRTEGPLGWRVAQKRGLEGGGEEGDSPRTSVGQLEMRAFRPW